MDLDQKIDCLSDNLGQHKKPRLKKFWIAFGAFAVTFILGTMLVLPIYDDRRGLDILLSYFSENTENVVDVGEEQFNNTEDLGWELLDDNKILHMWNQYNDYYYNVSNGIQFGNHYQEYWTQNVLMLGYYDGDEWNLIYRTDELNNFNKDIEGETEDYINATIWKDLSYGSYDFRLAIRYTLGVNDSDLTIIPYIKNLGIEIPYVLGFGWEMKDIQIDATPENDYIDINRTSYYLNQTLDNTYTNLSSSRFEICEDITNTTGKYLYLTWDKNLTYKVTVKSRANQYNAPVTLFIKVGTLDVGQEKFTEMHWLDAQTVTYYYDNWDTPVIEWATNPQMMCDNVLTNFAQTTQDRDDQSLISNTCGGDDLGTITKVELRAYGKVDAWPGDDVTLTPGGPCMFSPVAGWTTYKDITAVQGDGWTWFEVDQQVVMVQAGVRSGPPQLVYCAKVEIRVTYTRDKYPYEVYLGSSVKIEFPSGRKLVRNSTGGLWCTFQESNDVHIANSSDDGVTWTDLEVWGDSLSMFPSIAIDSNDVVHMVWGGLHVGQATVKQIRYVNSTDWINIVNLTDDGTYHQEYPAIAVDSSDNLHIVWEKGHTEAHREDVAYINSTDNGGSWNAEQTITNEANTYDVIWYPSIAINSTDSIHVVFMCQDFANLKDQILYMKSDDEGITWSQWDGDAITNDASYNQRHPVIAIDDNDVLHVTWYGIDQANGYNQIGYSYNDSSSWSTVEWLTDHASLDQYYPSISISGDGYVHIVWDGRTDGGQYIYNDTSSWSGNTTIADWDIAYPNLIGSTQHPTVDSAKINRPATGYVLIVSTSVNVTYINGSVTWDEAEAPPENNPPTQTGESPTNGSANVDVSGGVPNLYVICNDADGGDTLTAVWSSNSTSETWYDFATNVSISPGDNITQSNANFSTELTIYYWRINLTDGTDWNNETYHFTTATNETWQVVNDTINGEFTNTTTWQNVNTTINGEFTNTSVAITWQNVNTTINGVFTNTTLWQDVDTSINGIFTNTTVWYNVDITYNGEFTNTTIWQDVDTSINGEFTNISIRVWQDIDTAYNGEFTNVSTRTWQDVDNTINGLFTNTTLWKDVDNTINGIFTNTTIWQGVDTSINGLFTNATTWQNVDTSINGIFTNVSARIWQNVNDTVNGIFTNGTTWHNVDVSINGAFTNTTTWEDVDTTYDGVFTNATNWQDVDNIYNGEFTNTSTKIWQVVNDTVNGAFTNASIRVWQNVNTTVNGAFTNTTLWYDVDVSINGLFTNATLWYDVDVTFNGIFTNATAWQDVDTAINGEFTNISSKTWQNVNDTINGAFTNITTWKVVDNTINGEFTNGSVWHNVDISYNGEFTNTTLWQGVDTSINGEFTNVSARTWQVVNDTVNGVFTNTTTWHDVNTTINGEFTNGTVWRNVDTTYNGIFTNTTSWQVIDNIYNGEFTNVSTKIWQVVDDTINGAFTNASIRTWQNVNTTINGVFTNTTLWQDVDTSINGIFTNTTVWYNVDITYNGEFTNTTIWQDVDTSINGEFTNISIRVWQDVDTSINGEFTNVSVRIWQNVNDTINGVFTNTTTWYNVDISINGVFINGTVWRNVDISINGIFTNVSVVNITITSEYPTNGSTNIPVNTSLHFTVNHTLGYLMNITVYTGSNLTNVSALLGSFNSVTNGTYYLGYHNASELNTEYAWRVNVTDGYGNYVQETYNFTTTSIPTIGAIFTLEGYSMGMVITFACMFGILFFIMGVKWKRKRRYKEEYDEQKTRWR